MTNLLTPEQSVSNASGFFGKLSDFFQKRDKLNIWQWADKYRYLGKGVSNVSKLGAVKYNSSLTPHQREIQESGTDPEVQMTVMIGASQIMGKTEIFNNVTGYHIHWNPTSIIVMYPTIEAAEKYSKKKFTPMISATPSLASLILPSRERDSGNTILVKEFHGGAIYFVGANSTPSLRGASGEVLLGDEIDSNKGSAGDEGDPVELLWKRGESYPSCIKMLASTPTIRGDSAIEKVFDESDRRYWEGPCPKCNQYQVLKWSQVSWIKGKPETACILCSKCAAALDDANRLELYYHGRWKALGEFRGIRGYHFSGIYCMWPAQKGYKNRLHQFAEEHLRAVKKGREALKVWTNTFLAESFAEEALGPSHEPLLLRREEYGPVLTEKVLVLTCAADVQRDRIEAEVKGWGLGQESWGIQFVRLMGNTNQLEVWQAFDEFLNKRFEHPCGTSLRIACTVIDSGDPVTKKSVYSFVRPRQGNRVFAIKGSGSVGAPLSVGRLQQNKILLYSVGVDVAKSTVYERIVMDVPGPRYMHFPIDYKMSNGDMHITGYEESFFRQLVAEKVIIKYVRGFPQRQWIKVYERNEALDINAYQLAALEILNPDLKIIALQMKMPERPEPKEYILKGDAQHHKSEPQENTDPDVAQNPPVKTKPTITMMKPRLFKFGGWKR